MPPPIPVALQEPSRRRVGALAVKIIAHAREEEQVMDPAAILVAEYLKKT